MAKSSLVKSFFYAFKGIGFALKERNFKLHILAGTIAVLAGWFYCISIGEWLAVIICIGGVMALEIVNTGIEGIVDMISPEHNEKAGKIKDLAAGAVLVFSIAALVAGLLIFIPYII